MSNEFSASFWTHDCFSISSLKMQEHAPEIFGNRNTRQQQPCRLKISFANMFGRKCNAAWICVLLVFYQHSEEMFLTCKLFIQSFAVLLFSYNIHCT